ncbi:MAG: glutamate synthase large subunit, partial [Thermomonas sp.]
MKAASPIGLYDPRDERDACGFGLIAQLDDAPSRGLVDAALVALARMTHRGGVAADGLSGDGCGLLLKQPERFLRTLAHESKIALGSQFAAGLVFLPHDDALAAQARETLRTTLADVQLAIAGWRTPPLDVEACGASARKTMPRIEQVFVTPLLDVEGARPTPDAFRLAL